jgi:hypothetical protein
MWEDPIVADIHRTREKLAAEYGFDVKAIFADFRRRQVALGARLVRQKKGVDGSRPFGPSGCAASEAVTP